MHDGQCQKIEINFESFGRVGLQGAKIIVFSVGLWLFSHTLIIDKMPQSEFVKCSQVKKGGKFYSLSFSQISTFLGRSSMGKSLPEWNIFVCTCG